MDKFIVEIFFRFLMRTVVIAVAAFTFTAMFAAPADAHHHTRRHANANAVAASAAGSGEIDFALAFADDDDDDDYAASIASATIAAGDTAAEAEFREEWAQDFSSLFEDEGFAFVDGIDTTYAWSTHRINTGTAGRFDYKAMTPECTIRIPLVDPAAGRFYVFPHEGDHVRVTSPFGPRRFLWHYGMDTKLNTGDTVRSMFDGIVRVIQFERRGYGNVVVVRHHHGLETLYGHLHRVTVEPNQRVRAGEMIGYGGNTGRSTGAHLHFEARYYGEPFDPRHMVNFQTFALKSDTLVLTRDNFEYLTEQRRKVVHTVRRGENLGSIARRYGTTVGNLCRLNGITPRTTLRVGRRLVVRSGREPERQVAAAATTSAPTAVTTATPVTTADAAATATVEPTLSAETTADVSTQ